VFVYQKIGVSSYRRYAGGARFGTDHERGGGILRVVATSAKVRNEIAGARRIIPRGVVIEELESNALVRRSPPMEYPNA
jgi:hypothetical protein